LKGNFERESGQFMSNLRSIKQKPVDIEIEGKIYKLVYTLNSIIEVEEEYGSLNAALDKMEEGSIKAIRKLIWAGFIQEHPEITEVQVGAMLPMESMSEIADIIAEVLGGSMPEAEEELNPIKN